MKKFRKTYTARIQKSLQLNNDFLVNHLRTSTEIFLTNEEIEIYERKDDRPELTAKKLLAILAVGGLIALSLVSPNLFSAIGRFSGNNMYFDRKQLKKARQYLKAKRYIKVKTRGSHQYIEITKAGENSILRDVLNQLKIMPEQQWSGNWYIVMFDIPERMKWARDTLRVKLKSMGFYQIQKSVFISPFPCKEELDFLVQLFDIPEYIRVLRTNEISYFEDLKKAFHLA